MLFLRIDQAIYVSGYMVKNSEPWSWVDQRIYLRDYWPVPSPDLSLEVWVVNPFVFLMFS